MFKKFKGSISDIIIVLILGYFGYVYQRKFDRTDIIGSILIILSLGVWLVARYHLGDAFSILPQAKTIVKNGIYSKIRHPIYLCSIIASLGLCLMYKESWAYVVWIALIILQIFRAKKEEQVLFEKFGQEYLNYKNSVWF